MRDLIKHNYLYHVFKIMSYWWDCCLLWSL